MAKQHSYRKLYKHINLFLGVVIGISISGIAILGLAIFLADRALPGVSVAGQPVGLLTSQQISHQLNNRLTLFHTLNFVEGGNEWSLKLTQIDWQASTADTVKSTISYGKNWSSWVHRLSEGQWPTEGWVNMPISYKYNEELLDRQINNISDQIYIPSLEPEVLINQSSESSRLKIQPGNLGQQVNRNELKKTIINSLNQLSSDPINVPLSTTDTRISPQQETNLRQRAEKLIDKQIIFDHNNKQIVWVGSQIVKLLHPDGYKEDLLENYLNDIETQTTIQAKNAVFTFDPKTNRATEFQPEVLGQQLDRSVLQPKIKEELDKLINEPDSSRKMELVFQTQYPEVKVADINDLGIRELLAIGESKYKGSIPGRKYNVSLAASRIAGVLIPPNQDFSFNKQVGEVSNLTGYKKAYVIRSGQTVLDDGGGVCQVSTTIFRAALKAGLPIVERKPHAYRVGYYEQDSKPGVDATVYSPSTNLIFTNDTPAHILVQTKVDEVNNHLVVEIYGTADGRHVELGTPKLWGQTEPPPDLYVDDPTLPNGEIKQVEHKAWGAKTSFDWKVTREDEILQERTFYSNYRPWGNVFLKGTGQNI